MLSEHLVTKRYEWIRQIHYLCYYQWLQFTPLTEGDTSPLIGGSPHTAVFSIRTVVCGTTIQNNACRRTSSIQLVPSCRVTPISCWHCSPNCHSTLVVSPVVWQTQGRGRTEAAPAPVPISVNAMISPVWSMPYSLDAASRTVCH